MNAALREILETANSDKYYWEKELLELKDDQKRLTILEVEKASLELRFQHLEEQSQERQELIEKLEARDEHYIERCAGCCMMSWDVGG